MSLAIVYSRARQGIQAPLVSVEVHISNGLPSLSIVGLPEAAVKESKDRVRGALLNSRLEFPTRRITVNLAPADLPKEGGRFDLAIAIGILAASGQVDKKAAAEYEYIGELSLGGELRPIKGTLAVAVHCARSGRELILPQANAEESALVEGCRIIAAEHLLHICAHLNRAQPIPPYQAELIARPRPPQCDFSDVHGQYQAKRTLEVAASGGHNLLMLGAPGTGKSMLATRFPSILPPLSESQALETAAIASLSDQGFDPADWKVPPFRSPHHTASSVAMVGGGSHPRPGEISLSHNGTLFLDELPEFERKVLEVLREPLETGTITISRAAHQASFPARFQLIAAMNPCPCGYLGDPSGRCHCTLEQVQRYRSRISGPLLDRIDMHIDVPRISHQTLRDGDHGGTENSARVRERVEAARYLAIDRRGRLNAQLTPSEVKKYCRLEPASDRLLEHAMNRFGLSHRAYHRILKLARTIADLEGSDGICAHHLGEAIGYRQLDRKN